MRTMKIISCRAFVLVVVLLTLPRVPAQTPNTEHITEADKLLVRSFLERQKMKTLQTTSLSNLRQIGIALFEFETEYGSFPNEKTGVLVKEAVAAKSDLKAKTA